VSRQKSCSDPIRHRTDGRVSREVRRRTRLLITSCLPILAHFNSKEPGISKRLKLTLGKSPSGAMAAFPERSEEYEAAQNLLSAFDAEMVNGKIQVPPGENGT